MPLTFDAKKNFAYSVVAVAPSPATSGTSLTVATGDGAKFPATPFNAVVWPTAVQPTTSNAEVVRVTNIAGDVFTISRTQESSTNRAILVNDQIAVNITAKSLTDIESAFVTAGAVTAPVGGAIMWFTDVAPTGWLLLRGQAESRATYATLFALWGTTYGAGDGSTTFNVPDLQARIPIGKGLSAPLNTLGATAGAWDHTHAAGSLAVASHTHGPGTLAVASHSHGSGSLAVASHTHGPGTLGVASHSHGASGLSTDSAGSHTHTGSTSTNGNHSHTVGSDNELTGDQNSFDFAPGGGETSANGDHSHTFTTDSGGSHSHGVSGSTAGSSPAVDAGLTGSASPAVNSGSTGTTAPAVDAGATGATAPAVSSGSTAAANPPVLVVNFIVRALTTI